MCAKTYKLRGQAWIIFEEPNAANSALVALEGFVFYDKPLVSMFGSFNIKYFFPDLHVKHLAIARSLSDNTARRAGLTVERSSEIRQRRKADSQAKQKAKEKLQVSETPKNDALSSVSSNRAAVSSNTLMVQGLPNSTTEHMLRVLFEQFAGFEHSYFEKGKTGTAFVTFHGVAQATVALKGLQGFRLNPTHTLALSYAI